MLPTMLIINLIGSGSMHDKMRKAMFANIKGHKVRLNTMITINTGRLDRRVKLVEIHKKDSTKICVLKNGHMFRVPKSSVQFK